MGDRLWCRRDCHRPTPGQTTPTSATIRINLNRGGSLLRLCLLALASLAAFGPSPGHARELRWRELAVQATLDTEGRLHVRETHAMVFSGAWNGGERVFDLRPGQDLDFHHLERVDPAQGTTRLAEGNLDRVDHWDWTAGDTLRWRSRLPGDPPFDETEIIYVLDYTLSNVLIPQGDGYLLDHDFAFPSREGDIEGFVLDIVAAPEWILPSGLVLHQEGGPLRPGQSWLVTADLSHTGEGPLDGVTLPLGAHWRHSGLIVALLLMGWLFNRFLAREDRAGRFDVVESPPSIDQTWLQEHVLSWLPEEVGALWDEKIGAPEVAALIARLVSENKLESSVEQVGRFFKRNVLQLKRKIEIAELKGYEKKLIKKLFWSGRRSVDTDAIRKHYRTKGFSPAATISKGIERSIKSRLPGQEQDKPSWKRTGWLFAATVACAVVELIMRPQPTLEWGILAGLAWTICFVWGLVAARRWRRRVSGLKTRILTFAFPCVALAWALWKLPTIFGSEYIVSAPRHLGTIALALLVAATTSCLVNQASMRVHRTRLEQRQRLGIARRWWKKELDRESPSLNDDLVPFLIALGLDRSIDNWAREYGQRALSPDRTHSLSRGSSGSGSTWTGGGGTFGGAGATAAWAAAATGLGAGVSAASSGSSSGGGGGGGGSSGGGGGGGW